MLHDPASRNLIAAARFDELRRHARPRNTDEPVDGIPRPRGFRRLRRLAAR